MSEGIGGIDLNGDAAGLARRIRELETMVDHLADANIRAAELVAELEEARAVEDALRRRAEEVALQQAIDRTVASCRYIGELAVTAMAALVDASALECTTAILYLIRDDKLILVGSAGEAKFGEVACRETLRRDLRYWWSGHGEVVLSLRAQGRRVALLFLRVPHRYEWRDRWLPSLRSLGEHLGNAVDRLQIAARERELICKLADARDRAIAATEAKDHFLATMSHELRTPLNAIIGYSEMLEEDALDDGDEAALRDLRRISSSGKHLLALINDVLDLTKIEAGKVVLMRERYRVAEVLGEVEAIIVPLVERNHNTLEVDIKGELGELVGDCAKLRQILLNLLGNACKFTERGTITLRGSVEAEHDLVLIEVADSGIGMSEEEVVRVFEPFVQAADSTARRYGGTGLGLTISANYAALMGGSIQVASTPGIGTTFTLTLPREPA